MNTEHHAPAPAAPIPVRPEHFCRWGTCSGCIWSRNGGCSLPASADGVPPHVILDALFAITPDGLLAMARRGAELAAKEEAHGR